MHLQGSTCHHASPMLADWQQVLAGLAGLMLRGVGILLRLRLLCSLVHTFLSIGPCRPQRIETAQPS